MRNEVKVNRTLGWR